MYNRFSSAIFAVLFFIVLLFIVSSADSADYSNDKFHVSIVVPDQWKLLKENQTDNNLDVLFRSVDKKQTISLSAIRTKSKVDLEKLAAFDTQLFRNLGSFVNSKAYAAKNIRTLGFFPPTRIEKYYKAGKQINKLVCRANANFGYVLLCRSSNDNFTEFDKTVDSFKSAIPLKELWGSIVGGFGGWVENVIIGLILVGILYLLGKLGSSLRSGIETKKALEEIKSDLAQKGKTVNERWYQYMRKANLRIILSIAVFFALYGVIFVAAPLKEFLFSLLGLIPIILGFFGILFVVDGEGLGESIGNII